jgi:hypothetical protein
LADVFSSVSADDGQWRRLPLPKSISDAPYQSIEGLFMYDQLLHVLIEKREGKTALQIYDPGTLAVVSPLLRCILGECSQGGTVRVCVVVPRSHGKVGRSHHHQEEDVVHQPYAMRKQGMF